MKLKAKISAGILLLFFLGLLSEISLFPHTHIVDGHIIVHSHPYSGTSQNPGHGHSESQLVLISLLASTLLAAALFRLLVVLPPRDAGLFFDLREGFVLPVESRGNCLRGPPASAPLV